MLQILENKKHLIIYVTNGVPEKCARKLCLGFLKIVTFCVVNGFANTRHSVNMFQQEITQPSATVEGVAI